MQGMSLYEVGDRVTINNEYPDLIYVGLIGIVKKTPVADRPGTFYHVVLPETKNVVYLDEIELDAADLPTFDAEFIVHGATTGHTEEVVAADEEDAWRVAEERAGTVYSVASITLTST